MGGCVFLQSILLEITMTASTQTNHFNLHVNGVGYLNRVRWVETKSAGRKAQPFLACSIAALRGNADQPDYTYFDLRVSGSEALEMVEQLMVDVEQQRKVVVSFRVGDIYPHLYERDVRDQTGRPTGQREPAVLIKGRLLLINSISIDGENVFRRESQDDGHTAESHDSQEGSQYQDQQQAQEPAERPAPAPSRQQQQGVREDRAQAPGSYQGRPAQQQRNMQAPRQQQERGNAYRAGHAVGRAARVARDHMPA